MTLDVEDEAGAWLFAQRWAAAHVECGWTVNADQADDGIEDTPERLVLGPDDLAPEQPGTEPEDAETLGE